MAWTCPECAKKFKNANQWHSCARVDLDAHFRNKSADVRAAFEKIIAHMREVGEIQLNPVKTAIQVKKTATFLSIKPKRDHLEIEFQLDREDETFPVYKCLRVSRNRVLHCAVIEGPEDVDRRLLGWLEESYELVS